MISIKGMEPDFILSYCFKDRSGRIIDSRQSRIPLIPASNTKLLTGFASTVVLGPEAHFDLQGSVDGDRLILSGGPTPLFNKEALQGLADFVNDHPLSSHDSAKIAFSNQFIEDEYLSPYWQIGNIGSAWLSPISNFSYNENCVRKISPEEPENPAELHLKDDDFRAVENPKEHFITKVEQALGIKLNEVKAEAPISGEVIHSESIAEILKHTEVYSCNFSAEVLLKAVGRKKLGKGDWKNGIVAVSNVISDFMGHVPHIQLRDGSGLSRTNQFSTDFLSSFILKISQSPHKGFLDMLATPGSGTLRARFSDVKDEQIKAKTGTLDGVSTMTGYLASREVSFSIMLNNYFGHKKPGFELVDSVLKSFINENEVKSSHFS